MPENREMFLDELSPEQQQQAQANLTSTPAQPEGFDPVDILSPQGLAELSINSKGKDFDPVEWGAANPDKLKDPNTVAKLADTYGLLKQRGFKFRDIDPVEATKSVLKIFPAMAKWGGTALELGVVNPLARAVLPDQDPASEREFEEIRAKKSAELVSSTELGVTGLGEMVKKGGEKISRLFGFSKSPNEQEPHERVEDFWSAVGMAQQRQKISEGKGTAVSAVLGGVIADMEKGGTKVDPEVVNELAAGDPVTFLAFPGGFKVVAASGKTLGQFASKAQAVQLVTRLRQAQRAAARTARAEQATVGSLERIKGTVGAMSPTGQALAQPILTEAGQIATQASRAAGAAEQGLAAAEQAVAASPAARLVQGVQDVGSRLVEPLGRARDALGSAVTRGADIALGAGAAVTGAGLRTFEGVGKGIAAFIPPIATPRALRVGYELAGKAGKQQLGVAKQLVSGAREGFSPSLRLLSDVARGAPTVAAGAGRGFLMLDVPLAAVTSETPAETAHMPVFGAFLGAVGAAPRAAGRVVQGQTIAPRAWGSEAAMRDYRSFSGLDQAHKFSVESLNDPAKTQWLAGIREFLQPTKAQLYLVSDPAMLRDALKRYAPGAEESWYNAAAQQRAVTLSMVDDAGVSRKVVLLRDANAAPHEAFHPFQDVLGERAMQQIDQLVYDEYSPVWDQLGENYVRQFAGSKGLAEYQSRGEGWQEAILDITSGGKQWREQLSPEQVDQVANLYLSREISAEVGDAVLRSSGPSLLQNPSFPGKLARVLGKTMVGLGMEPFARVETEGQGVPLRMEPTQKIQEAFRTGIEGLKVEQRRPDVGGTPPYPQRGGTRSPAPPPGTAPVEPAAQTTPAPAAPAEPATAAAEARAIAAEAPDTPTTRGQRSPREVLGEIAENIASGEGLIVDYRSAPGQPAGAVTSNRDARRAIIEAFRDMPQSARALWEKQFFPDRVIRTQAGKIQVQGWAPEVFASNAHKMAKALSEGNAADLSPYPIDPKTGTFTEQGWRQLHEDVNVFVRNQLAGQTGSGQPLVVPAETAARGFSQPARRGEAGGSLSQDRADFISSLFGVPVPKTPRIGQVFPRNLAGQEVSEATFPGRTSVPVEPRAPFAGAKAEELGIAGREIREVNPFRAEIAKRGIKPSLIEAVQRLNLESIADVSPTGAAVPQFRGVEFTLQAGFQPKPREPRAIKSAAIRISGPEGERIVEGFMHADAYEKAFGEGIIPRDVTVVDGFTANDGSFLDRNQAFKRAQELQQIPIEREFPSLESEKFAANRKFQPQALEDTVQQVRDADMPALRELVKNTSGRFGGGLTGFAYDLGAGLKEPGQLRALDDARQFHAAESKKALKAKDYDAAATNGAKGQLFREAIEFATGTGSAEVGRVRDYPGFEPPLRGVSVPAPDSLIGGQFQPARSARPEREIITSAAIRLPDGEIHEGFVHGMAYQKAGISPVSDNRPIALQAIEEGFMAEKNGQRRFVNREEAFAIGKAAQQIEAGSPAESTAKFLSLSEDRPALESFSFQESRRFQPKQPKQDEDVSGIPGKYTPPETPVLAGAIKGGFLPAEVPRSDNTALGIPVEGVDSSVRYVGENIGLRPVRFQPKADGSDVTEPSPSYPDAHKLTEKKGGSENLWVRQSKETSNADRVLLVQITPELMYPEGPDPVSTPYYDKLYSGARPGYSRAQDFWELPQWVAVATHNLGSKADFYAVRNVAEAQSFLEKSNYGRVGFSVMDVGKAVTEQLVPHIKGEVDLGGYTDRTGAVAKNPRAHIWDSMNAWIESMGMTYQKGFDYRHFRGTEIIPRLELSAGCRHRCTFCTIDRKVTNSPVEEINKQVDSFSDLNAKLVYLNDKTFGQSPNVKEMPRLYKEMKTANPEFDGFIVQTTAAQMKLFTDEFLRESGIRYVELGVETYNDPILKALRKPATEKLIDEGVEKMRRNGINFIPNIVIGFPEETAASYARTMGWLKANEDVISHVNTYNLAVYKGTEMAEKVKVKTAADADENSPNKSFYEDPKIHEDFAKQVYEFGSTQLDKTPVTQRPESQFQPRNAAQFAPKRKSKRALENAVGDEPIEVVHYSSKSGLSEISPTFFGKGKATPTDLRGGEKSFFFVKGSDLGQDANLFGAGGLTTYESTIPGGAIYDLRAGKEDPIGWRRTLNREEADDNVKKAGYSGIVLDTADGRTVVAMFEPVPVTERTEVSAPGIEAAFLPKEDKRMPLRSWLSKSGEVKAAEPSHFQSGAGLIQRLTLDPIEDAKKAGWARIEIVPGDAIYVESRRLTSSQKRALEDEAFARELPVLDDGGKIIIDRPTRSDEDPKFLPGDGRKQKGDFKKFRDTYGEFILDVWSSQDAPPKASELPKLYKSGMRALRKELPGKRIYRTIFSDAPDLEAPGRHWTTDESIAESWVSASRGKGSRQILTRTLPSDLSKLESLVDLDATVSARLTASEGEVVLRGEGGVSESGIERAFQPRERNLSEEEAKSAGYDTVELGDFPIKRLEVPGARLDFEEGENGLWILGIETDPQFRRQGKATELMKAIYRKDKQVFHGTFTDEGAAYLQPLIRRIDPEAQFQPRGETESELRETAEIEKAENYFSIGHDTKGSRVWVWDAPERNVRDADGVKYTHGSFVSHEIADRTFKGRYDPESKVVSVVFPERLKPADREATVDDIPTGVYNALKRKYRPNSFAVFQPRGETEGLPGLDVPREPLSASARASMTRQELRQHFPEAVVPRASGEKISSDIVGSPLYKRAGDEQAAVEQFAKRLVEFAREYESAPEYQAGSKWYSDFTPRLKKAFGKDAQLMAELLAATSPNTGVETNFGYAFDALKSLRSGRFDKIIPKFEEGLSKMEDGSWESWYNRELKAGNIVNPPAEPTPAAFLARWIDKHDLKPKQSNGKLYGQHSIPVLQVFARRWLDLNRGPKVRNFVENLLGQGDGATIDVWASRTMRWAGYEGFSDRWRILPENATGISDADFAFSQKAFRAAAEELGMKPSDLQGALWFAEKRRWADNGWGRLDLGDFREELKKVPMLEKGYQQRLKSSGQAGKKRAPEAEQLGLAVEPRFK